MIKTEIKLNGYLNSDWYCISFEIKDETIISEISNDFIEFENFLISKYQKKVTKNSFMDHIKALLK